MVGFPVSLGKALTLTPLRPEDASELFVAIDENREHLRSWLAWVDSTRSEEDVARFISSVQTPLPNLNVLIRCNGQIIGSLGTGNMISRNSSTAEVGYWIAEKFQGKGIMRSACKVVVNALFEAGINRVAILCATNNLRSAAIPKSLGFTCEGEAREALRLHSEFLNCYVFSLLKREWKEKFGELGAS